jgi:hypothetical protein
MALQPEVKEGFGIGKKNKNPAVRGGAGWL